MAKLVTCVWAWAVMQKPPENRRKQNTIQTTDEPTDGPTLKNLVSGARDKKRMSQIILRHFYKVKVRSHMLQVN